MKMKKEYLHLRLVFQIIPVVIMLDSIQGPGFRSDEQL